MSPTRFERKMIPRRGRTNYNFWQKSKKNYCFFGHWYWKCDFPDFYWFLVVFYLKRSENQSISWRTVDRRPKRIFVSEVRFVSALPMRITLVQFLKASRINENIEKSTRNRWKNEGRKKKTLRDKCSWFVDDLGSIMGSKSVQKANKNGGDFWSKKGKRKRGTKGGPKEL